MKNDFRLHYIKIAGSIALFGNAILAIMKLVTGFLTKSMAITGDGIDSSTDVLIAILTLIAAAISMKPGDEKHPWGHARAESVATMVLSFIIFYAGSSLVVSSVKKLIFSEINAEISFASIIVALISIGGKIILMLSQLYFGKIADSEIVKANAINMKSDIFLSGGVLLGLVSSAFFKCPILDPIIAILVGLWVVKNAINLFKDTNLELMDGNADSSLYAKLFEAATSVEGITNPHSARIRKLANHYDIDLDVEVEPTMTIFEAHELSELAEARIREAIPDAYTVMIHIEPHNSGFHQPEEKFGLKPKD